MFSTKMVETDFLVLALWNGLIINVSRETIQILKESFDYWLNLYEFIFLVFNIVIYLIL